MKTSIFKIATLLVFASVAFTSCSVEYREHHRRGRVEEIRVYDGDHHYDQHRY